MLEMILRCYPQPVRLDPPYLLRKFGVTEEEFDQITNEDIKAELLDGELIVHSPATLRHDDLCTFLSFLVRGYSDHSQLGIVYGANNAVVRLAGHRRLAPDLMFVRAERANLATGRQLEGPPDLVIEVLSQSTRRYDLEEKRQVYREAEIDEIWLVDDDDHRVILDIRQRRGYREEIKRRGKVSSRVLPGFWLSATWLGQPKLPDALGCLHQILE